MLLVVLLLLFFFFKQKTAYEMRISDWSSDVCSSDLERLHDSPHHPSLASPQMGSHSRSSWRAHRHREGPSDATAGRPSGASRPFRSTRAQDASLCRSLSGDRSEERRGGRAIVCTCQYWWWRDH